MTGQDTEHDTSSDHNSHASLSDHDDDPNTIADMERLMALQELEEHDDEHVDLHGPRDVVNLANDVHEHNLGQEAAQEDILQGNNRFHSSSMFLRKFRYSTTSFLVAFLHVIYVLRTRKQVYLALLYLTSSKVSYIVLGNAFLAFLIGIFHWAIQTFLNGLRLIESETILDHIRWNVTETCISLTMFRQDISVKTIIIFLFIILGKCLHWANELRVNHLRMTEEVFLFLEDGDGLRFDHATHDEMRADQVQIWWFWQALGMFMPKALKDKCFALYRNTPRVRSNHVKIMALMCILGVFDVLSLAYCVSHLQADGPSIYILFIFETSVLVVSIMSSATLYSIHALDGFITVLQRVILDRHEAPHESHDERHSGDEDLHDAVPPQPVPIPANYHDRLPKYMLQQITSLWRDQRVTLTFMVELMALGSKFLFHLTLFMAMFSLYGLPINIIRDFYMAFNKFKQRLIAFSSYRNLTSNMDSRFDSVTTEEELDAAGRICIICRDRMEVRGIHGDCKKLPICGHTFHKVCLREWLVQQQNCPTCRGDIQANEARAKILMQQEASRNDAPLSPEEEEEEEENTGEKENSGQTMPNDGDNTNDNDNMAYKELPCPILCQVIVPQGTLLYKFQTMHSNRKHLEPLQSLKCGSLVVCTATLEYHDVGQDGDSVPSRKYLHTPGGCISSCDVKQLLELQPTAIIDDMK